MKIKKVEVKTPKSPEKKVPKAEPKQEAAGDVQSVGNGSLDSQEDSLIQKGKRSRRALFDSDEEDSDTDVGSDNSEMVYATDEETDVNESGDLKSDTSSPKKKKKDLTQKAPASVSDSKTSRSTRSSGRNQKQPQPECSKSNGDHKTKNGVQPKTCKCKGKQCKCSPDSEVESKVKPDHSSKEPEDDPMRDFDDEDIEDLKKSISPAEAEEDDSQTDTEPTQDKKRTSSQASLEETQESPLNKKAKKGPAVVESGPMEVKKDPDLKIEPLVYNDSDHEEELKKSGSESEESDFEIRPKKRITRVTKNPNPSSRRSSISGEDRPGPKSRKSLIEISSSDESQKGPKCDVDYDAMDPGDTDDLKYQAQVVLTPLDPNQVDKIMKDRGIFSWRRQEKVSETPDEDGSSDDDVVRDQEMLARRRKSRKLSAVTLKKKRRVVIASDSDEREESESSETDEKSEEEDNSRAKKKAKKVPKGKKGKKGRILTEAELEEETRIATKNEANRKKRLSERQKRYNDIIETKMMHAKDGGKRLILDIDTRSKKVNVEVHRTLADALKPHQEDGIKFLYNCLIESVDHLKKGDEGSGCILAHSMGLGKTLQTIAFIHTIFVNANTAQFFKKALIVCPVNTVKNWINEFNVWLFDNNLTDFMVFDFDAEKTPVGRLATLKNFKAQRQAVLVIGITMYSNQVLNAANSKSKKIKPAMRELVKSELIDGPDLVVVDEGHLLKNDKSNLNKALSMIQTRRRVILTGTPLQNNLNEYFVMCDFIKPKLLGTKKEFTNRFVGPINQGQYEHSSELDVRIMKKRVHVLHKLLDACVQRMDYSVLAPYLQPKHEYVLKVRLTPEQISIYRHYLDNFSQKNMQNRSDTGRTGKGYLFNDCQVLRLICAHPALLDIHSGREKKRIAEREEENWITSDEDSGKSHDSSEEDVICEDDPADPQPSTSKRVTRATKKSNAGPATPEVVELPNEPEWYTQYLPEDHCEVPLSGKFMMLLEILEMCEKIGDKLVVFSQSLDTLDMIETCLDIIHKRHHEYKEEKKEEEEEKVTPEPSDLVQDKISLRNTWLPGLDYFRIDGAVAGDSRKRTIDKFNDPNNLRGRLFLLSTKAGSLGINLIGGNRCIIFDASWNPTHDVQAIFRIYRFGQLKPSYVYRFVCKGTMEERIYDRQVIKQALASRVVDEHQIERHFSQDEVYELYKFDPEPKDVPTPLVPKDRLLADILHSDKTKNLIIAYHEHDSLLENRPDQNLTEEERQDAWNEFEQEKDFGLRQKLELEAKLKQQQRQHDFILQQQQMQATYASTSSAGSSQGSQSANYRNIAPQQAAFDIGEEKLATLTLNQLLASLSVRRGFTMSRMMPGDQQDLIYQDAIAFFTAKISEYTKYFYAFDKQEPRTQTTIDNMNACNAIVSNLTKEHQNIGPYLEMRKQQKVQADIQMINKQTEEVD